MTETCNFPMCWEQNGLSKCFKCGCLTCDYHIKVRNKPVLIICEMCVPHCEICWDCDDVEDCRKCMKPFCSYHFSNKDTCKRCSLIEIIEQAEEAKIDKLYEKLIK